MRFVDLETAKARDGLRLVLLKGAPSPWSQAAKAIVEIKRIDAVGVWKLPGDAAVPAWTGQPNAPVAMFDDEPPHTGWAEILMLSERLSSTPALVPEDLETRMRMFGLCNELMGQAGLTWNTRILMVELSIRTDGARSFPRAVADYLGRRYGYVPGAEAQARARVSEILGALDGQLSAHAQAGPYYFGDRLTALDIYAAATLDTIDPLPEDQCPMHPRSRAAFEALREEYGDLLPKRLLRHRDMMHDRHMPLPMQV